MTGIKSYGDKMSPLRYTYILMGRRIFSEIPIKCSSSTIQSLLECRQLFVVVVVDVADGVDDDDPLAGVALMLSGDGIAGV